MNGRERVDQLFDAGRSMDPAKRRKIWKPRGDQWMPLHDAVVK